MTIQFPPSDFNTVGSGFFLYPLTATAFWPRRHVDVNLGALQPSSDRDCEIRVLKSVMASELFHPLFAWLSSKKSVKLEGIGES